MTTTTIHVSGPLFDGRAGHEVAEFCDEAVRQVSGQALAEVQYNLDRSIKHPTPYYETQINIRDEPPNTRVVNDAGVIYGPWLEGVGSRNFPKTRFRGYFAFRRAVQTVTAKAGPLLEFTLRPYLERMNHG